MTTGVFTRAARALCLIAACAAVPVPPAWAAQIDSASFFGLRRGMSESEILLRAGPPDLVTSGGTREVEVVSGTAVPDDDGNLHLHTVRRLDAPVLERWHYVPDRSESDPHLTIVSFRGGVVWSLERRKVFSRDHLPEDPDRPAAGAEPAPLSDHEVRVRRAERTLDAAQRYATTRERLRAAAAGREPGAAGTGIHRGVDPAGVPYYGDVPPQTGVRAGD